MRTENGASSSDRGLTVLAIRHGHVHGDDGGTRAVIGRVGTLVAGSLEEVVLKGVVRGDARLRVVIEHAQYQIFELEVVGHRVAQFACPPTAWASVLDAQDVVELLRPRNLIFLAIFRFFQHVSVIGTGIKRL